MDARPDPDGDKRRALAAASRAAGKAKKATATRDGLICLAHDAGASLREIAEEVDLSHTQIRRILLRLLDEAGVEAVPLDIEVPE